MWLNILGLYIYGLVKANIMKSQNTNKLPFKYDGTMSGSALTYVSIFVKTIFKIWYIIINLKLHVEMTSNGMDP